MSPLLSVIIVAYKSRDEIEACIASLPCMLEGRPVEVIVVDNAAGTSDAIDDLVANWFPWVHLISPPSNVGFGRGNNLGFALSRGEYVLFLNPDTVSNAAALEHCLARLREDTGIGMVSPRLELPDGSMDLACRRSIPTLWDGFCRASGLAAAFPRVATFGGYNLTYLPANGSYDVGAINGAFMMGRRAVFMHVAAPAPDAVFDESFFMYGDDLDLCIRVARAGYRIVYDGRVVITHLKGVSIAKDYDRMASAIFDANCEVYLKHFDPRGSRLVRAKYRLAFALWKYVALLRARMRGHRGVRPV